MSSESVIASEAKQSSPTRRLLRHFVPRNDTLTPTGGHGLFEASR
jgi:hypothetical protein